MENIIAPMLENTAQAGFRLKYLEVLNWGTFDKVRWHIQPDGNNALLTGDIGSGKSTLVDALTCLLVPHNKIIFNKAAGAEGKERNLLSYVRGEYKKEKEEITKVAKKIYLRPEDDTYSVIIGGFQNEGFSEIISLAQFFWIGKDGKVDKLLAIATIPLNIKDHFSGFLDVNDLKKKLRAIEGIELFNDNFTQYSEHFRRLFGMNSDKAIDLFYQTVSMKSVTSLTEFVREQMLEKTDVKEQISALLKRFDDLNKAHAAVVNAREQYQILKPLTEQSIEYGELLQHIAEIESMLELMPAWFAEKKNAMLGVEILKEEELLAQENEKNTRLIELQEDYENRRTTILQDIENNGGRRLAQIEQETQQQEREKTKKLENMEEYDVLANACGLGKVNNITDYQRNFQKALALLEGSKQKDILLREKRDVTISEVRKLESELSLEKQELQSLQARKTQVPAWLVAFRIQLCTDLRIPEEELPFAGELLQVNEEEQKWEGAVERLMHDLGISLLVPAEHYKSVSHYINNNPLKGADGRGIKLTFLDTNLQQLPRVNKELDQDSVVYKLDIKPDSAMYTWLDAYLSRTFGDYICTDTLGLQHVPFGITPQGLIKSGRIRHTKDDRRKLEDKRNYVLGWSNTEKIKTLQWSVQQLEDNIHNLQVELKGIEKQQEDNNNSKLAADRILRIKDYDSIDWKKHVRIIQELKQEYLMLSENNDILAQLQIAKAKVEDGIRQCKDNVKQCLEAIGGFKKSIQMHSESRQQALADLNGVLDSDKLKWYPLLDAKMADVKLTIKNIDQKKDEFRKQYQGEGGELRKLNSSKGAYQTNIEKRMRQIKEHSKAEYSEIAENIEARHEYMKKFEQLAGEDLKRHEQRFKEELNKNVINSIAVFDNQLQKHEKDIKEKIRTINQHLHEIVYNAVQDTYITILMDQSVNKEIRLFREELKKCYLHAFDIEDLYTEEKYEQVKRILDRFASMENLDKEWTNSVTDVRQWFEFNASERFRADDTEKEFYEGSGGKSGGQKEKLAYTILASALAYQFGLQFGESKSRSFRFVVIDEAFGRGSDDSTRYGLELFQKLNLQLLIVTPLQKIHIIEGHVNSFHFVSNREGNNSQVNNFTKSEYAIEKLKRNNIFKQKLAQ
ncbi:Uncharacterized protein YPO0396 [Chitinophaga jiangningensis]|uniref:Uncharacterized protein YPO0396 n=1 Tax=Chitinophaga jiangningensis TaxID=1419482 RepID=A0A1M6YBR9_9BACT|nr:ATP-binding protein [Chitinophaga jiangningensis]SHL15754.1 Uncharacterized protein YPO0396 [Chitinophaga jiangningensis]